MPPRCPPAALVAPRRAGLRAAAVAGALATAVLGGCGDTAKLQVDQGTGPNPTLPEPTRSLLPTVRVADAVGWGTGQQPQPAAGLQVQAFATGLNHPRWLYTLPNGDVLVAETNAPAPAPDAKKGLRERVMGWVMQKAGARVPSADRLVLLRDTDGDGVADVRTTFLAGLHSPFGMALVDGMLYIANTDAVVRVPYRDGQTTAAEAPRTVAPLPALPINHHWTKNLIAHPDGRRLFVTVGSNSNVGENGMDVEAGRAQIDELDLATGELKTFATGLRNPNGMAWVPGTPAPVLWTVVNERDELGSDLVPDYLTAVQPGGFYGWPYSWYGRHVDPRVRPPRPDLVERALVPDYALGPHTASLGLAWLQPGLLRTLLGEGVVIGQHGSWNRKPPSGYRVVFVRFANGAPTGLPVTLLGGFLSPDRRSAYGRPVGVAQDARGALLIADDVGNTVWRLQVDPAASAVPR